MEFYNPDTKTEINQTRKIFLAPVEWDLSDVPD
jgi:hypothetical protein